MPRVAKTETKEVIPKRAPRRTVARAPRKATAASEAKEKPTRIVTGQGEAAPRRKAPTRLAETGVVGTHPKHISQHKAIYVSGSLFAVGMIATLLIGYSDEGQINPAAVISEQNARAAGGGEPSADNSSDTVVPVQNTAAAATSYAASGLVPAGVAEVPVPTPIEQEATTASSTDESSESATTTDAASEGKGEEETTKDVSPTEEVSSESQ